MRILVVSPYPVFPVETGFAVRISQICQYLMGKQHDVFLLTAEINKINKIPSPFKKSNIYSFRHRWGFQHFFNLKVFKALKSIVRDEKIELIILSFPYQVFMVEKICRKFDIPFFLDEHNIEFLRFKRMKRNSIANVVRLVESFAIRKAARIFTVSENDKQILQEYFHREAELMPNGVDVNTFVCEENSSELRSVLGLNNKFIVLFFGALDYMPNCEAITYINDAIAPATAKKDMDVVFLIVGKKPPALNYHASVRILGAVESIKEYIQMSDMVICPLLAGGGTRIKILESLACGKIVLSTRIGAEGLDVKHNKDIIFADIDNFSDEILKVKNGEINTEIAHNARKAALQYDWKNTLKPLDNITL